MCQVGEGGKDGGVQARACTAASRTSSGRAHRVPGMFWACMGAPRLAKVVRFLSQGGYQRAGWSAGYTLDMVREVGEDQGGLSV